MRFLGTVTSMVHHSKSPETKATQNVVHRPTCLSANCLFLEDNSAKNKSVKQCLSNLTEECVSGESIIFKMGLIFCTFSNFDFLKIMSYKWFGP